MTDRSAEVHFPFVPATVAITSPLQRLSQLIRVLCEALAARLAQDAAAAPILVCAMTRLRSLAVRLQRLVSNPPAYRFAFNLPTFRLPALPRSPASRHRIVLPRRFGWMVKLVPAADTCADELQRLLSDPEMTALLAKAPQAARILRPLCHMLGIAAEPPTDPKPAPQPPPFPPRRPTPQPPINPPAPLPAAKSQP